MMWHYSITWPRARHEASPSRAHPKEHLHEPLIHGARAVLRSAKLAQNRNPFDLLSTRVGHNQSRRRASTKFRKNIPGVQTNC
jgi:hypothetical protein